MLGFIILFGTKQVESELGTGHFVCPNCRMSRPFRHTAMKRWFTLFFIPLIPLGETGRFVQCGGCGARYDDRTLGPGQPWM